MQAKKKIVFCDSVKEVTSSYNQVRVPNIYFVTNKWLNLCINIQSFAQELRVSSEKTNSAPKGQPMFKTLESLTVGGEFLKLKRIFTSRSQIPPQDVLEILSSPNSVDEMYDNGAKVENLPKNMDYLSTVQKVN